MSVRDVGGGRSNAVRGPVPRLADGNGRASGGGGGTAARGGTMLIVGCLRGVSGGAIGTATGGGGRTPGRLGGSSVGRVRSDSDSRRGTGMVSTTDCGTLVAPAGGAASSARAPAAVSVAA